MANLDTTRHPHASGKRYVAARMQQGRSILDADWNADVQLKREDIRQTLEELACAYGSTNAGFSVTDVVDASVEIANGLTAYTYDFSLRPGTLFVGGMHFETGPDETFLTQQDWLQLDTSSDNVPPFQPTVASLVGQAFLDPEEVGSPARNDFVYLEAWEQPVTAIEDSELRERALGGPDTSVRIRRMRRIHVAANVSDSDPAEAFEQLKADLETAGTGAFEGESVEFKSAARLTVTPVTESSEQPCGPKPPSGYIGHEDQAIRVEVRNETSIIWSFGNAAPLYRVTVGVGGTTVTLLNRPRDSRLQPKAGQIVELIPWGSKLPNDEKVAELTGELIRVDKGYEPATGELILAQPPSAEVLSWYENHPDHQSPRDTEHPSYFYMRLWNRGGDVDSDVLLEASDAPVELGHTGLQVQLSGAGSDGDYWIIAARRSTPDIVVPWQLLTNEAPHGPRRYYVPLALLRWEAPLRYLTEAEKDQYDLDEIVSFEQQNGTYAVWGPLRKRILDGRRRLARLCSGCGTIIVGDGVNTYGMVDSLELALGLLPASGGRIHLLPGDHIGEVTLDSVQDITITGCSRRSNIINKTITGGGGSIYAQGDPLITLKDCQNIVLADIFVRPESAVGIKLENTVNNNRDIRIEGVHFDVQGSVPTPNYALPQAAILGLGGERITVENCHVEIVDVLNYVPAIVLGGTELRIRGNYIHVEATQDPVAHAMGGVQILSFSQDVEVTDNIIRGGWGHGISLGHLITVIVGGSLDLDLDANASWSNLNRTLGDALSNLHNFGVAGESATGMNVDEYWTPGGPVIDVRIRDNRILDMGMSGVSTGGFADVNDPERHRFIVAIDVDVHRNEIVGNMQLDVLDPTVFTDFDVAVGGVCLSAAINLLVRENRIVDNGVDYNTPIAGVGVVTGQGLVITDNFIADNGIEYDTPDDPIAYVGLRGGIAVTEVVFTRGYTFRDALTGVTVLRPSFDLVNNDVALTVRKNEVYHRVGKALWVAAGFGPIVVSENSFHGLGDPVTSASIESSQLCYGDPGSIELTFEAQGSCVEISNYATSPLLTYTATIPTMLYGDENTPTFENGPIEFHANDVSLNWHWLDGYPCSVLLSSLDCIKVTDNVMSANMNSAHVPDAGGAGSDDAQFLLDAIADPPPANMSYLLVNCWAGATSTVQASGNRFEERRFDCLFSYLGSHAAAFGSQPADATRTQTANAAMTSMNVGSHCMVSITSPGVGSLPVVVGPANADNVTIYEAISGCGVEAVVDISGGNQRVCIKPTP
jgi:hypothetical protein